MRRGASRCSRSCQLTALTEKVCLSEEHLLKMEREPEQFEVTLRNHMAAVEKFLAVIESE